MPSQPTHIRRTVAQARRWVRQHELWRDGETVVAACSGGLDSTAMVGLLTLLAPSLGHSVAVAHVDHQLRTGSADDATTASDLAARFGVPFAIRRLQLATGANLQARARTARYDALASMLAELNGAAIATAHHADDQAETFLMRACRGAGASGLAGARPKRGSVVRPVLHLKRAQLREIAVFMGLQWREDPSNADQRYTRNGVRHEVLPRLETAISDAIAGLARSAENLRADEDDNGHWLRVALDVLAQVEVSDGRPVSLTFPRRHLPTDAAALAKWHFAVAEQLGVIGGSHRAAQQLISTLRQQTASESTCETLGLHWRITNDEVVAKVADVARAQCAD
jgi:tRNA(Ile)-lysidine synthase